MKIHVQSIAATGLAVSTLAIGVAFFGTSGSAVQAQTPPPATQGQGSGQALEIGPPVVTLNADPGQTLKTQLSLRDVSRDKLLVRAQVNDFTAAGEDGTPKLLLDENGAAPKEPSPYSIRSWVAPLAEQTLEPRQLKQLPVTINVPADAAPGGYFGVVRFTASAPELNGNGGGVSLAASLGALILVKVNGEAKEDLKLIDFFTSKNADDAKKSSLFEAAPVKFTQRIKNDGNIFEQPTGQVTVKDMFGKVVAGVNVNLAKRNILPGTTRKFEEPLDKTVIGNKKLFGRYTANLNVTYGTGAAKKTINESTSFWVIPWKLILIVLVVLIGGFFAVRYALKRYNRSVIKKAYGGGKRK